MLYGMVALVAGGLTILISWFIVRKVAIVLAILTPVAGAIVALAVFVDMDPWLQWSLGIVAGAGIATAVQLPTAVLRGGSTATTAGVANPGVSTSETIGSGRVSGVAIFVPIAIPFLLVALVLGVIQIARKIRRARGPARGD